MIVAASGHTSPASVVGSGRLPAESLGLLTARWRRQRDVLPDPGRPRTPVAPGDAASTRLTLRYVDQVLGDAEVDTRSRSASERAGSGSDQYSTTRVSLAPAHTLRQMRSGDALLLHGTLLPAHPNPSLLPDRKLARLPPGDARPASPTSHSSARPTGPVWPPLGGRRSRLASGQVRRWKSATTRGGHQVLMVRRDLGDPSRVAIAETGYRRMAVDGKPEMWVRDWVAETQARLDRLEHGHSHERASEIGMHGL